MNGHDKQLEKRARRKSSPLQSFLQLPWFTFRNVARCHFVLFYDDDAVVNACLLWPRVQVPSLDDWLRYLCECIVLTNLFHLKPWDITGMVMKGAFLGCTIQHRDEMYCSASNRFLISIFRTSGSFSIPWMGFACDGWDSTTRSSRYQVDHAQHCREIPCKVQITSNHLPTPSIQIQLSDHWSALFLHKCQGYTNFKIWCTNLKNRLPFQTLPLSVEIPP